MSPSLALDFSSGTLDPRITFTRSTIGTFYRGAFNQNLVTQSETFSGWFTDGATPATSGESNPQNSGNAYGITESATTAVHRFGFTTISARQPSSQVTVSAYVKAGLRTLVAIGNNALSGTTVTFQLTGSGSYGTLLSNVISASINFVGNGWYRCSVTLLTATNGGVTPMLNVYTGTLGSPVASYAGNNTAPAVYVWGVQATEGSLLTPYIPTTTAAITQGQIAASQPWNLLLQSQAFDNTTTWGNVIGGTGVNPVRTANNATAPDGTMTADTITFDAGSGTLATDRSQIAQTVTGVLSGRQYTLSFWIRSQSGTAQLNVRHVGGSTHTLVTATTTWQRVTITETEGGGASVQIGIRQNTNGTINSTATVELWGAQLNEGATALDYSPTTTLANYLPRFEYNPVSGAFRGLLIEGGATNVITGLSALTGLTLTPNAITSPSGAVDANLIQKSDTTTPRYARWSTTLTAATNTAYTASMFVKRGNVDMSTSLEYNNFSDWGGTSWTVNFAVTSSGVSVSSQTNATGSVQPIGNGWYRVTATFTTGATAPTSNGLILSKISGTTGDNIYLWGGQLEAQAFASSYIPTVGGTVARGADLADITGSAFSSWFNQNEGTLYAEQQVYALIGNSAAAFIQQDSSNYYEIGQGVASSQADLVRFYVQLAGGNDVVLTTTLTGLSVGNTIRSAAAYRVNDVAFSCNANTVQTDNTFTIQTPVSMGLGRPRGSNLRSILLRRISYWPTRLPNDQLVSLTTIPSTALAMTAIQAGAKIDLTWTQVPGVDGATYEVERSTDGGATWSPLTTSFGLAFNDTTALFPGTYTYRVRANVGGEVTDWSSQVSETTVDVPSAPGSLTVTGATTSSISLSWTDSTGEDSYGIEVSPDGLGSWSLAGTAPANTTTFTHTPLAESVQRYYRVNGINKAGGGVYSSTVNSWTVPLAPTSLTATAVSSSQIDLAWTDVSTGNQSYKVERSTDNVNWTQIATGLAANATSYSAVGLTGSTLYYFRVRAANAARDSAYSNTASATTQAGGLVPAWSLDFSSGEPWANGTNYVFSSTASTTRTFVNSSGYVAPCVANLLLYSEDFSTTWSSYNATVGTNTATAPDNASTADEIREGTGTANWTRYQSVSGLSTSTIYTISCYFKKPTSNGRDFCTLGIWLSGSTTNTFSQVFNIVNGTLGSSNTVGTVNNTSAAITDAGNGWYRCSISFSTGASTSLFAFAGASNASSPSWSTGLPSYAGTLNNCVLAWGAQLVTGSAPLPYSATTTSSNGIPRLTHNSSGSRLGLLVEEQRTNRAPNSVLLDGSWVTGGQVTRTTQTSIATPRGASVSASKLSGTSLTATSSWYFAANSLASGDYTLSVYAKADGADFLYLFVADGTNDHGRYFDLSNGTIGNTVGTLVSSSITDAGNGWYRCVITWNNPSIASRYPALLPSTTNATGRSSQVGTSPNGILVTAAQFEAASTASSWIETTSTTTVTRSADLVHVLDSAITSWGDPGALVVHFYPPSQAGTLLSTDDAATAQVGIEANPVTDVRAFWSSGSTAAETMTTGVQKAVHYWTGSTSKLCLNGGPVRSGTNNFTIANADFVTLGAEATDSAGVPGTFSQYANCIIRKVEFYSGTLTDANLQTITS